MSGSRRGADALLISELIAGHTITTAARTAGISEGTARRRMRDPAFRAKVTQGQDEVIEAAIRALAASTEAAALTLRALLGSKTTDSVRLNAATRIIELTESLRTSRQVEERLAAIEVLLLPATNETPTNIQKIGG
jgi:phage terminase small subunit